jgi:hypothetical protein
MDRVDPALLADVIDGLVLEPELVASVLHVVLQPLVDRELASLDTATRIEVVAALDATASLAASPSLSREQVLMLFEPIEALGLDAVGVFVQSLAEQLGAQNGLFRGSVREQLRAKLDIIVTTLETDQRFSSILEVFAELSAEAILSDYSRTGSELYAANLLYAHERLLRHLTTPALRRRIDALDGIVAYS